MIETRSFEDRFWSKVDTTSGPDACWPWTAWVDPKTGYGHFGIKVGNRHTKTTAQRVAYELATGDILGEREVDHTCFNHACCNPVHLRAVTHKQNGENRRGARVDNRSSGVLGVTWDKRVGRWQAKVMHDGKYHWVGRFDCLDDAAEAVRLKRIELYTHNCLDRL